MIYKKKFRKFLHEHEIAKVIDLCCQTRYSERNQALILITYLHGLRAGETCNLKWDQIDLKNDTISIIRQKGGVDGTHPFFSKREKELLIKLHEKRDIKNPYVFVSERNERFEPQNFYRITLKLGKMAEFDFIFTPHMLRHSCGTSCAEEEVPLMTIKNLLGHRRVSSTELYLHLSTRSFNNIHNGSIFK